MFNKNNLKTLLAILVAILISLISILVVADRVNKIPVFKEAEESLDETQEVAMNLSMAAIGVSVIITLLPDDYATPMGNTLADMSKYCVAIIAIIIFEKILLNQGLSFVFTYCVPLLCGLFVLTMITRKKIIKTIATKLLIISIAIVVVVPIGTRISGSVTAQGIEDLENTIAQVEKFNLNHTKNESNSTTSKNVFDTLSDAFQNVIKNASDLLEQIKLIIKNFIMGIAILIVGSLVIPLLTFVVLVWILNQLLQFDSFREASDKTKEQMLDLIEKSKAVMQNVLDKESEHEAE
ncbi:MAG: hypothetical protein K5675_02950 [Lachnospiraceae bacterium]|nr:hypothetical protein [Lachnospiraceae bacterium]